MADFVLKCVDSCEVRTFECPAAKVRPQTQPPRQLVTPSSPTGVDEIVTPPPDEPETEVSSRAPRATFEEVSRAVGCLDPKAIFEGGTHCDFYSMMCAIKYELGGGEEAKNLLRPWVMIYGTDAKKREWEKEFDAIDQEHPKSPTIKTQCVGSKA
jgi:hypothetical protein